MVGFENRGYEMARNIESPPNNLKKMIASAGLKHGEFAEETGHAPGTISKYISGDIQIPDKELFKFAKILKCSPWQIKFQQPPMPLLAVNRANFRYTFDPTHPAHKEFLEQDKMRVVWRFAADYNQKYKDKCVYMDHSFDPNVACVLWDMDVNHPKSPDHFLDYAWCDGALELVDFAAMLENRIDQNAVNHFCYAMDYDNVLHYGTLYKEKPNSRYWSLHSILFPEQHDLNLKWACPSLGFMTRPELRNVRIETVENETSKRISEMEKTNYQRHNGVMTKFMG